LGPTSSWDVLSIWCLIFSGPPVQAKIEMSSISIFGNFHFRNIESTFNFQNVESTFYFSSTVLI
jgi:hypothetical protein